MAQLSRADKVLQSSKERKTGILFINTKEFYGAVIHVHNQIIKHLDHRSFHVYVANNKRGDCAKEFRKNENVVIKDYDLGVTFRGTRGIIGIADRMVNSLRVPLNILRLSWLVRREKIRAIHISSDPRMALFGVPVSMLGGAKLVVHVHEDPGISGGIRRRLMDFSLKRAHAVITISRFIKDRVAELGIRQERIWPVLNVVDLEKFNPSVDGSGIRNELGIDSDTPVLATVGRLCPDKGQMDLLKALVEVRKVVPNFKAVVVGFDDRQKMPDGRSYLAELEEFASENGLNDAVIFPGPRPDVPQIYAAADIAVIPSVWDEPFGLVVVEAMASGKAVVASRAGGIPEIIEEGVTGILAPRNSPRELAQGIVRLLQDNELRKKMGEEARKRAQEQFYEGRMAPEVEAVYRSVIGANMSVSITASD